MTSRDTATWMSGVTSISWPIPDRCFVGFPRKQSGDRGKKNTAAFVVGLFFGF